MVTSSFGPGHAGRTEQSRTGPSRDGSGGDTRTITRPTPEMLIHGRNRTVEAERKMLSGSGLALKAGYRERPRLRGRRHRQRAKANRRIARDRRTAGDPTPTRR